MKYLKRLRTGVTRVAHFVIRRSWHFPWYYWSQFCTESGRFDSKPPFYGSPCYNVIETALLWKHMRFQKVTSKVKS